MNFKTTLILLILLAGAGVAVYFTQNKSAEPPKDSSKAKKLLAIEGGDVQTLTITPASGKKIVLQRDGIGWKFLEPFTGPAEAGYVNSIISDLAGLESQTSVDVSDSSGLKSPRYVVELATKDGKTTTVNIGDRSGVGDRLYVQLKGNAKADLVAAGVDEQLDKPLDELRDKKLVSLTSDQVKYISIDRPEGKLELVKEGGEWKLTKPEPFPTDTSAVTDLLFAVTGLRATAFVQGDVKSPLYGLGTDAKKVTISTAAPSTTQPTTRPTSITIAFGGPDTIMKENVFATVVGSGALVKIAKTSTSFLDRKPLELRDKTIVDVDPSSVNELSVVVDSPATTQPTTKPAENRQYAVKRRPPPATQPATTQASTQPAPTTWMAADGKDANDAVVSAILTSLHPLKAERYVESAPTGGKTITVKLETGGTGVRPTGHTELKIFDPGEGKPPVGVYNGLNFELERSLVEKLETDFSKPGPPPAPAMPAPEMGPGGPMGPMMP